MAHWRNTWRPAKFFFLDARAAFPLLAACLHIRLWTILTAIGVIVLFWWLERIGMSFPAAMRAARSYSSGDDRPPRRRQKKRFQVDYGAAAALDKADGTSVIKAKKTTKSDKEVKG